MPVTHLTDATLRAFDKAPPEHGKQLNYFDDPAKGGIKGLYLKHSYGGTLTFYLMHYGKQGQSKQHKLGRYPALMLAAARVKARELQVELEKDRDHIKKKKQAEIDAEASLVTFAVVVEEFNRLYIEKEGFRTGKVTMQQIEKHLMPTFRDVEFNKIRRSAVMKRLDEIEAKSGAAMADSVLAIFRSISNFRLLRDDDYVSPFVQGMRGMKRYKRNPRERVLNDAEIKAFWNATASLGTYGALARICLLTGQRRSKTNFMKWADIKDGIWTLGHAHREKPNCGAIILPPLAMSIIDEQPVIDRNPYVFPAMYKRGPINAFGQYHIELMKLMRVEIPEMPSHTIHDLRRTFRSRCSKLGVDRDLAERCLGHVVGNAIERTYDQYAYLEEMAKVFLAIEMHIRDIVTPPPANVVRIGRRR